MTSVLITRPQAAAESLAASLQKLGYQTVIEPLLTIKPTNEKRPTVKIDAVMITSSNALTALEESRSDISGILASQCFCVGARTADKARSFGFQNVEHSNGDGVELAELIARNLNKKSAILHIAGRDIDAKAHASLRQQGHSLIDWVVYEAIAVAGLTPATQQSLQQQKLDAILLFSQRTAETWTELLTGAGLEACCQSLAAICLSPPIAENIRSLNWRSLAFAPAATEDAVITRLQEICPVRS